MCIGISLCQHMSPSVASIWWISDAVLLPDFPLSSGIPICRGFTHIARQSLTASHTEFPTQVRSDRVTDDGIDEVQDDRTKEREDQIFHNCFETFWKNHTVLGFLTAATSRCRFLTSDILKKEKEQGGHDHNVKEGPQQPPPYSKHVLNK